MIQWADYLPVLIPLVVAQVVLAVFSAVHVVKHPSYRFGNKVLWLIIVLVFQFIGPALYFLVGRGDQE